MEIRRGFTEGYRRLTLAIVLVATIGVVFFLFATRVSGADLANPQEQHVVGSSEIQARIDQHVQQADENRQAIQDMLQREDVRRVAGSAGLDLERASAAAATLSGPSLETLAAQAREVNSGVVGGDNKIVLSTTAIVIILLVLILLLN